MRILESDDLPTAQFATRSFSKGVFFRYVKLFFTAELAPYKKRMSNNEVGSTKYEVRNTKYEVRSTNYELRFTNS